MKLILKQLVLVSFLGLIITLFTVNAEMADTTAGERRAGVCFSCHSKDGISKLPGTPHLAGQDRQYLENALKAYRIGQERSNPTMTAMAKPLSDKDIVDISAYFSKLPYMK
ncbi:MAG: hypothetical protein BWK79_20200 [Beggiatoa sp. IS2]|nr:MAG: hypothetical protein BWK79_20200 [Beggiatoa sp. IS2]